MATSDVSARLARLDQLAGELKSRDFATTAELAAELGTSMRTLRRDLAVLRERGVPIEADRGRGGGLRVAGAWSAGRVHLDSAEALDLLLSLAIAEKIGSPILLENLRSIRRKIAAAFAEPSERRIRSLRSRVLLGQAASSGVVAGFSQPPKPVVAPLVDAFFNQRCATIEYEDQSGTRTRRTIEAQYLYFNLPVWYVIAWDRLRDAVRSFRIDRIRSVIVEGVTFRMRPPAPFLEAGESEARPI
jgi:predicted DNA-binding transcriptional regulator YafY